VRRVSVRCRDVKVFQTFNARKCSLFANGNGEE